MSSPWLFFLLINTNLPYTLSTTTNIIIISSSSKKQLSQSSSSSQLVASTGKRSRSSAGPKVVTAGISESILQSDIEGDEEENVVTQTSKRCKQDGRKPVDRSRSRALAATANGAACSSSVGNSGFYWDETAPTAEDAEQHARYSIYQIKVGHIFTTGLWCWPLLFYFLACPNSNSYLIYRGNQPGRTRLCRCVANLKYFSARYLKSSSPTYLKFFSAVLKILRCQFLIL